MVLTLFIVAAVVGFAQANTFRSMRGSGGLVKRWGGALLILVGAWLIALAIWGEVLLTILPGSVS